jgi:chemotaxis signal transduction protein
MMNEKKMKAAPAPEEEKSKEDELDHYLLIVLDEDKYFIALPYVFRIINPLDIYLLPDTLPFIAGVTNFSGEIIPMVDLKKMLQLPGTGKDMGRKFIICKYLDMKVGFIVDNVIDSLQVDSAKIKTDTTRVLENDFISGEFVHRKEVVGVIDIAKFIDTHKAS